MIEKEFIPYEQALALKELGFDEPCLDFFDDTKELFYNHGNKEKIHIGNSVVAPLYQQAFRWFWKKYKLSSYIRLNDKYKPLSWEWVIEGEIFGGETECKKGWSYEEAELECLKKLIEICKKN